MTVKNHRLEEKIGEIAFTLFAARGDQVDPSGSAVLIARDYALTARHVLEGHCQTFNNNCRFPRIGEKLANYRTYAIHHVAGHGAIVRVVDKCWVSTLTDLAIIRFKDPSPEEANVLKGVSGPVLKLTPPSMGSPVCGYGFHDPNFVMKPVVELTSSIDWRVKGRTATGHVTDLYSERRDRGFLDFPCFQTNSDFRHSMSGGPVFDQSGRVCGLISAGSSFTEEGATSCSYVVSLWPLVAIVMDEIVVDKPLKKVLAHELFKREIFVAEDWSRVSVVADLNCEFINSVSLHDDSGEILATIRNH